MNTFKSKLLFFFILFGSFFNLQAEGTAQWMPAGMRAGQEMCLMLYNDTDGNERLGTTGCSTDERINIRVSSNFANEVIYIGMNVFDNTTTHFRVMAPDGTQAYPLTPGTLVPVLSQPSGSNNTGEGYIANLTEARNGPEEVFGAGGYDAISITPTMAGDYYIEFNGANSTTYTSIGRHQVSYFDVTVANTNGLPEGLGNHTAINGRLNAFQWSLYNKLTGTGNQLTDAEFYLYQSDDSLVISVQWDEVSPGGWDIAFTRDGVQTSGNYFDDRQSQSYTTAGKGSVVGEFPIFFNDPDPTEYPSASDLPELNFLEYDRCSGSTCFLYNITKGGQVEVLIDLNDNGTFDPGTADRLLVDNQPAGTHCLAWDDLDGLGDLVVAGQAQAVIKYQAGIFHMPLGDVEANSNGFDRTLVRPLSYLTASDSGRIYYDHTQAGGAFGAGDFDFEGETTNANIWSPDDGNQLYLNTWFSFAEIRDTLIVTFNSCDRDEDGLSDVLDIDDDNDGIPDIVEMYKGDHDGDGTPDYEDTQFCTDVFQGVNGWSCADGLPDPSDDLDGDGIRNAIDSDFPGCGNVLSGACSNYDADLDGIPDYLDRDSDNDGISDLLEIGGVDTDGDGQIDDLTDTDGDGLPDNYDNDDTDGPDGSAPCVSQPGCLQGVSTNPLLDTDNNGVTDNDRDTDGDGLADFIDLDSDNDGIPDVVEVGGTDTDGDGYADDYEDIDSDGFNDVIDGQICTDSTDIGTSTYVPGSSTGVSDGTNADGQPDGSFAELYALGDEIVLDFGVNLPVGSEYVITWRRKSSYGNTAFADIVLEESLSPGSGYSTNSTAPLTDEKADFISTLVTVENPMRYLRIGLATNSDDDIDLDAVKWYYNEDQCVVGDPILVSGADGNNDGIPDSYPTDDVDGDDVLNHLDLDADNDGIPDVVEAGGTDENGDGRADNYADTDADGFNDVIDGDVGNDGTAENSANALTLTGADTDNDGLPNSFPNDDFDGDSVQNYLDLDSDDDGILDVTEAGGTDSDRDGQEDSFTDLDEDGFNDEVDGDPTNALASGDDSNGSNTSSAATLTDADGNNDGAPDSILNDDFDNDDLYNFLDIDADNDGITDNTEGQSTATYTAPDNIDSDGDGIDDAYDSDDANFGGASSSFVLSDIDASSFPNTPDYLDQDADNDGISDIIEGHDTDQDGAGDSGSPANTGVSGGTTDVDGDGLLDGWDNNTSSKDPTNNDLGPISFPNDDTPETNELDWRETDDFDNDGIANVDDIDDDNDGILDIVEGCPDYTSLVASSFSVTNVGFITGIPDGQFAEIYTDGDLVTLDFGKVLPAGTRYEVTWSLRPGRTDPVIADIWESTDNSTFIARSSKPTLNTAATVTDTIFSENSFRYLRFGKGGTPSAREDYRIDAVAVLECADTDGDGFPDYLDYDSDNDGIQDIIEAGGIDSDEDGFVDGVFTDTDNDGWSNVFDPDNGGTELDDEDKDGDGFENRIDLDADNDGIVDIVEAGGVDANNDGRVDVTTDSDSDGWANTFDSDNGGSALPVEDGDGDGIENYLDLDSDSDGITDNVEGQSTLAFQAPLNSDTDQDGWDDRYDSDNGGTAITLSNNEGVGEPDYLDDDSDGDGFPDWQEGFDDDEDGDAQNDLEDRADAFETAAGNPLFYINTDDADNDGLPDWLEDDDADNVPNFLDPDNALYVDSNNDGVVDLYDAESEGVASTTPDTDGDGEYDFRDTDNQISLPVELIGFTAVSKGDRSKLIWATESELNNDYFLIERAGEDQDFEQIAQVDGAGTSNRRLDYFTYDENPLEGNNYYRLKQVDYNGEYSYSQIEVLQYKSEIMDISLYPNPTNGEQLFLTITEPKAGNYTLRVLSSEGKVLLVRELNLEAETLYFELELLNRLKLSSGTYFVGIQSVEGLKTLPFVVK